MSNFIALFRIGIKTDKAGKFILLFWFLNKSEAGKEEINLFEKLGKIKPSFSVSADRDTTVDIRKKVYCLQDSFRVRVVET